MVVSPRRGLSGSMAYTVIDAIAPVNEVGMEIYQKKYRVQKDGPLKARL